MKIIASILLLISGYTLNSFAQERNIRSHQDTVQAIAQKWLTVEAYDAIKVQDSEMQAQLKELDTLSLGTYNTMAQQSYTQTQFDSFKIEAKANNEWGHILEQMRDNNVIEFRNDSLIAKGKVVDSLAKWSVDGNFFIITTTGKVDTNKVSQIQQIKFNILTITSDSFVIKDIQPGASEPIIFKAYKGK